MNPAEESPAGKVMDEAIELAIEERSPYPERAAFLDADMPSLEKEMRRAAYDGMSVVLVSANGDKKVLLPETVLGS
ncbi:MAG TPA: hypothetical protein VF081_03235 [Solirubrobacterales bacterium]